MALAVASGGAFSPTGRLVVGLMLAAAIAAAAVRWAGRLEGGEWLLLAVVAWSGMSAVVSHAYPLAAKEMLVDWIVMWCILVVVRRAGDDDRNRIVWVAAGAAAIVAVVVVFESVATGTLRVGGVYVNPNVAVALMVPVIPLLFALQGARRRWLITIVAVVVAAGVVATGSRAGLIAAVIVVGVLIPGGRFRVAAVALAAAAAAALLVWRFAAAPDSLAWHRLAIWRAVWDLVLAHPVLGVGPGLLADATGVVRIAHAEPIATYGHIIGSAESTVLGLLVRSGWAGLVTAGAGLVALLRSAVRRGLLAAPPSIGVLLAIATLAAVHDVLDQGVVLWWWGLLVAWAIPVPDGGAESRSPLGVRATVATIAAGAVLWGIVQPAYARRLWWGGASTVELAERALRAEPWLAEAARWRVEDLLGRPDWSWQTAAEAQAWSRRLIDLHRGAAESWSLGGQVDSRIATQLGAWQRVVEAARDRYRTATGLEPRLPWHWFRWAQFERAMGEFDDAAALAERAVQQEPHFVRGWLFLARVRIDLGLYESARDARDHAHQAVRLAEGRRLSEYEGELVRFERWQVEELSRELD